MSNQPGDVSRSDSVYDAYMADDESEAVGKLDDWQVRKSGESVKASEPWFIKSEDWGIAHDVGTMGTYQCRPSHSVKFNWPKLLAKLTSFGAQLKALGSKIGSCRVSSLFGSSLQLDPANSGTDLLPAGAGYSPSNGYPSRDQAFSIGSRESQSEWDASGRKRESGGITERGNTRDSDASTINALMRRIETEMPGQLDRLLDSRLRAREQNNKTENGTKD